MRFVKKIIIAACLLILSGSAIAATLPSPTGYVNDFAHVLDSRTSTSLERTLTSLDAKTGAEVAVVTVGSLDDVPIEDYAVKLFQTWGIGKKGKDNGALILVAPTDRQVRIEVGYGLEGVINDALAGRIIRDKMIPAFRDGDFNKGIANGTMTVVSLIAKDANVSLGSGEENFGIGAEAPRKKSVYHTIFSIFIFLLMAYLFIRHPWLFLFFLSGMGGGGRSGGFGGGFGGFGGGLSGGGGASGRW
jgi:uncharacterized protein